jgi:hypothetical protein
MFLVLNVYQVFTGLSLEYIIWNSDLLGFLSYFFVSREKSCCVDLFILAVTRFINKNKTFLILSNLKMSRTFERLCSFIFLSTNPIEND